MSKIMPLEANDSDLILDELANFVKRSSKYSTIDEDIIKRIGKQEMLNRGRMKDAVKATKRKLHQIAGMYREKEIDFNGALADLKEAKALGEEQFRLECKNLMRFHSSTRERLPFLSSFYQDILNENEDVKSILDIGCGLHPLAIPWMGLSNSFIYTAIDIFTDLSKFLGNYFEIAGINGKAITMDIVRDLPNDNVDLAFILKTIPCLEQQEKGIGEWIVEKINAKRVLVSYPLKTVGGKNVGMADNYEKDFEQILKGRPWAVKRFEYPTELAYLITKS